MMKKIKNPLIFLFILCLLLSFVSLAFFFHDSFQKKNSRVSSNLNSLSAQEKEYLTNFFKVGFFMYGLGYTIYGEKPMSFETINMVKESKNIEGVDYMSIEYIFNLYRLREGWEVWQKYAHLFPLNGFSIIHYASPHAPNGSIDVAIINHQNFIRVVNDHLLDFQTVLNHPYSAEQILEKYLQGKGEEFIRIRNHDGLFGTLLGFGRDNSWEYMKRSGGETMEGFIEEGDVLNTRNILPPLFKVIADSEETTALRERYTREREKINLIYQENGFLEQVLNKLCGS